MSNIISVTKNGKTFVDYTQEKYEKNKHILDKAGYRLATEKEIADRLAKKGFKEAPVETAKATIGKKNKSNADNEAQNNDVIVGEATTI